MRKEVRQKERRWRLRSWQFRRYDNKSNGFKTRSDFDAEGRLADWQESRIVQLHPKDPDDGGPTPTPLKGGPMLDWNKAFAHQANVKYADVRDPDRFRNHYEDKRLGSGLFWLRDAKSKLRPPVVEMHLRRKTDEDLGVTLTSECIIDEVAGGSPASRAGMDLFEGYRVTEVTVDLAMEKSAGGRGIGLKCEGNVVVSVDNGSAAEIAGIAPRMRIVSVLQKASGEIARIPNCRGVVEAVFESATSERMVVTVSVPVTSGTSLDRISGTRQSGTTVGFILQRPNYVPSNASTNPKAFSLYENTLACPSVLAYAVAGKNYQPIVALLLQQGAVQPDTEGTSTLASVVGKLIDDRNMELAAHIVAMMGDNKGGLLHRYITSGNHDAVRWLVEKGCSLSEPSPTDGLTPLALAAKLGDSRAVTFLLEQGANQTIAEGGRGGDPLLQAILAGKDNVATLLVSQNQGATGEPLRVAASRGLVKFVKSLVGVNSDAVNDLSSDGKTCLWVALESAPVKPAQTTQVQTGRRRWVDDPEKSTGIFFLRDTEPAAGRALKAKDVNRRKHADPSSDISEVNFEELTVFLCSKGANLTASRDTHPLDYVDLAASKGMWRAVDALLDLIKKTLPMESLARVPPYVDTGKAELVKDRSTWLTNPSRAACRDVFSYAAASGQEAVLVKLLVEWGLQPSPGKDVGATRKNALDYAFEGSKVVPCLLLLSRGLLPTRHCTSTTREVRLLFSAVFDVVKPAVMRKKVGRKGSEKWEDPSVPFPKLPVNIFTYSVPGTVVSNPRVGARLQVPYGGTLRTGTVESEEDGILNTRLDGTQEVAPIELSQVIVFNDTGYTVLHKLVGRGHLALLEKLIRFGSSSPHSEQRFSPDKLPVNTVGSLVYRAVMQKEESILSSLIDTHKMKATVGLGMSPLLAAILHGSLSMVQKLVTAGGANVNESAKVLNVPQHRMHAAKDLSGRVVSPLYLASALLESEIALFLLSQHADVKIGRADGEGSQSPLHATLSVACNAVAAANTAHTPKKQVIRSAAARKISNALVRMSRDVSEVSQHVVGNPPVPTHVLNLAARRGYFGVVDEMLKKECNVAQAVATVFDEMNSTFNVPHVLHYLARAGEVDLLRAAVGHHRCVDGAVDLLLPEGTQGEGILRVFNKSFDRRKDLGSTADQALYANQPGALAYLLSRGVRLSRLSTSESPRIIPFVRHISVKGRTRDVRRSEFDKLALETALAPVSGAVQIRELLDLVERTSSREAGFNFLHAASVRPGCFEAGKLLVHERFDVNQAYSDPVLGEVTPAWLCAACNNIRLLEALVAAPTLRLEGRSPVPFAAMLGNKSLMNRLIELGADVNFGEVLVYPASVVKSMLPVARAIGGMRPRLRFGSNHCVTKVTGVWYAAYMGMEDMVSQLHAHGADLQDDTTTARRELCPSLAGYHSKPRAKQKKKDDEEERDDYYDNPEADVDSEKPLSFRARTKQELSRRKQLLSNHLELHSDGLQRDNEALVHMSLASSFGSLKQAFKASCAGGGTSAESVAAVCTAAGLDDETADYIASQVTPGMTWAAFRALFAKSSHPSGITAEVSFLDEDAVKLRPIWAVVAGAPLHPCKSKSKQSVRDKCDQYIRTARYIIRSDGLKGMSPEELTALVLVACQRGHWEMAVLIVKEGARASRSASKESHFLTEVPEDLLPGFQSIGARHPLHLAAKHLDREMFSLFLKRCKKQDVVALRDPNGYTALHSAILAINADVVDLLLELGYVDIETPAGKSTRTMHRVTKGRLVKEEREAVSGMTALMLASRVNSTSMVQRLLQAGASINAVDSEGNTALIHAAEMGNFQVVEALVSSNADVGVLNKYGYTALMRASARGQHEVALPLLQYWTRHDGLLSPTTSVLHCAVEGGCESVVEMLTTDFEPKLIDVLAHDNHHQSMRSSALWKSWALGRWQVKAKLVAHLKKREEAGCAELLEDDLDERVLAQLSRRDELSDEPEDTLLPGWLTNACELAARIHAKLNKVRGSKKSFPTELVDAPTVPPLRESLRVGCTSPRLRSTKDVGGTLQEQARLETMCLSSIQKEQADRRRSWSLLEWAVRANHAVAVKVLGDRSIPDSCCALHLAAERGNLDVVQILLQLQMTSVSSQDSRGRTALMRAIASGREKVALFLMSKTPARKLLKLTPDGQTLLHMCACSGLEDAVTHMIGCLVQLERRLKGEDNLNLHDFINIPDKHPELCDYDSEDEDDPERPAETPTTGFTPFEYSLMFGRPAIALRLAYGSTMSTVRSGTPSISLNPRFPGSAGYYLPVMSPSVRATLSEFFNDPSRSFDAGPFTIRGDFVRHPQTWSPNEEGKWPKEKSILTFSRLTWPDVRAIGLTNLSKIPWVADKLAEVVTFEHERSKYSQLLSCLDLQGRAFRLNTVSLNDLGAEERLVILQRLASALIVHRYTPRDYDWTSATGAVQDASVVGMEKTKKREPKKAKESRLAVAADGLAGQVTCVQMEYVTHPSQVKVSVDSEGVVHERFTVSEGCFVCGSVEAAIEAHFRRKERLATGEADLVLKEVTAWLRSQGNPLVQNLNVSVDWKAVDKYRFDSASDRIKSFEILTSNRGIWSIVPALAQISNDTTGKREKLALYPYSGIVFRRAGWIDGQFFATEEDARHPDNELVIHYDVRGGNARFSSVTKALSRLYLYHEVESLRMIMTGEQEAFKERVAPVLPGLRTKFEIEGGWKMVGGLDMVLMNLRRLLDDIHERLEGFVKAPPKRRKKTANSEWAELNQRPQEVTLQTLLLHALRSHVRSIGLLVSSKREPTAKLAAVSKTVIACTQTTAEHVKLPSDGLPNSQVLNAFYFSVVDAEVQRLQERAQNTISDAQQRLITYLPATTLSINWKTLSELEPEARLLALGMFCHERGVKVLQPLISGMSAGWDSKLGVFVRKYVYQVVIHCTTSWQSSTRFTFEGGVFHYEASLLAAAAGHRSLLSAQEIATELITHLEEVDTRERAKQEGENPMPAIADYVDPTHPIACWCTFNGRNLRDVVSGKKGVFYIRARNFLNCLCSRLPGVAAVQPFVVRLTSSSGEVVEADITVTAPPTDKEDASLFTVRYTAPEEVGTYLLHVTVNGEHVSRSPSKLRVFPAKEPDQLLADHPEITTVLVKLPVIFAFHTVDAVGNRLRRFANLPAIGNKVKLQSWKDVRKLHQQRGLEVPPKQELEKPEWVVRRILRGLNAVMLSEEEKPMAVITVSVECLVDHGVSFSVTSDAGGEMEIGTVVDDRSGGCTVRVVPTEPGEHNITVNMKFGQHELSCTRTFTVMNTHQAMEHFREHGMKPWEKNLRRIQTNKWENTGWRRWKKERAELRATCFIVPRDPARDPKQRDWKFVSDTSAWTSSLRTSGQDPKKRSDFNEWMHFRKECVLEGDTSTVPRWWLKDADVNRLAALHAREERFPAYQERILMRVSLHPPLVWKSLSKTLVLPASEIYAFDEGAKQTTSRPLSDAWPSAQLSDWYLQTTLDRNGGCTGKHAISIPLKSTGLSTLDQEMKRRRRDAALMAPLLALGRR
eukprot:TRINITY_DN7165_c0_g1_i2.p1 TRINITY_DN7165_c0_g1~~TRINITY_DN7165_c0_g1_i2.p1  ORF type:complete len:4012 (+),score=1230.47 TRINITY_DN7165_c0_g1_i2:1430-12037(+)